MKRAKFFTLGIIFGLFISVSMFVLVLEPYYETTYGHCKAYKN